MWRHSLRLGAAAFAIVATSQAALAQQFGPAERQAVLDRIAALSQGDLEQILTVVIPDFVGMLNRGMPARLDEVTTATAVTYAPTVVEYTYQIDEGVTFGPGMIDEQKAILVRTLCNQEDTFYILALGVTMMYHYRGAKADIGTFDIVIADCPASTPTK
ncbi:MAG: hypothetical protein KIS68_10700 [Bauldia sp.]|nr:hypothetical protein [Bauldia sp.]